MKFTINNKEVIAEQVTAGNLATAQGFDPSAEVGDYAITLPDRTVGIVAKAVFELLAEPA